MSKVRLRDFIKTDVGFFAINTYYHPKDKYIGFLRYLNLDMVGKDVIKKYNLNPNDIRTLGNERYIKIADTYKTYDILKEYFPNYLFYDETTTDVILHGIPKEDVLEILTPNERLMEIISNPQNDFEKKCKYLSDRLEEYGLNTKYMGITGSTVLKLNCQQSDIDFVIYGTKNHLKGREILKELFEKKDDYITPLPEDFWHKAYRKRIKDNTLTYNEFVMYEKRKYNRGLLFNTTMFDLLCTRDWNEITGNYGDYKYRGLGYAKIICDINDDRYVFDNPALYGINNVEILNFENKIIKNNKNNIINDKINIVDNYSKNNNKNNNNNHTDDDLELSSENIKEIASYTHTYAGQVFKNERAVVRGKLELVSGKKSSYYRIVVGTSREAFNEYIKLWDCNGQ